MAQPPELSEELEEQSSQLDAGDRIAIQNLGPGNAVAAGRGAQATVRNFIVNIPKPIAFAIVAIGLALVGMLGYFLYYSLQEKRPQTMTGEFNVAIAEFDVVDQNGEVSKSDDGKALAEFLFQRLDVNFAELDKKTVRYEIWSPAYTGRVEGKTPEERARAAEDLARRIGAHIVIYGVISQGDSYPQFGPEFYVSYKNFEEAQEITGQHELGKPLLISLPFDKTQFQAVQNPALAARVKALGLITIGLAYYSIDKYENALDYFKRAETIEGWVPSAGKEIVYLLLGNSNIRLASRDKKIGYLSSAHDAYATALMIDPAYARAKLGLGSVIYLQALGDPDNPSLTTTDLDGLAAAEAILQDVLNEKDLPKSANIQTKINFRLGQIYFVRAQLLGGDWEQQSRSKFETVIQDYEAGNIDVADLAGQSHARIGLIELLGGKPDLAIEHIKAATSLVTPFYQAHYYSMLGEIYASTGRIDQAIEAYTHAVQIAEFYGDEASVKKYTEALSKIRRK